MANESKQQEMKELRSRLIERADSDPSTHAYIKHEFDLAYNSGDLELLRAFDALFVPGSALDNTHEYVAHLRHVVPDEPLDKYFTQEHVTAFYQTAFALQVASGARVFNNVGGYEVMESHHPNIPLLKAVLERPEQYEQIVSLIRTRGITDPAVVLDLYREMCAQPRPLSEGTL